MRILEIDERRGLIEVLLEVPEDLYYFALFIEKGDIIYAWTFRQLKIERTTGSERGERVKVYIGIMVEKISYHKFSQKIRVTGKVVEAPEDLHIKGSYHTFSLGIGESVKIHKKSQRISKFIKELIKRAETHTRRVLILSIGEEEIAVGVLSPIGINVKSVFGYSPKKSRATKSLREAFQPVLKKITERVIKQGSERYDEIIVVTTEKLLKIVEEIIADLGVKARIIKVFEGGLSGIYEITKRHDLRQLFVEIRGFYENQEVEEIIKRLSREDNKVVLGIENIENAAKWGAVEKIILLEDLLFDDELRDKVLKILDEIYKSSGKIVIVSSESEAGEKLEKLGKIAAILYFPIQQSF